MYFINIWQNRRNEDDLSLSGLRRFELCQEELILQTSATIIYQVSFVAYDRVKFTFQFGKILDKRHNEGDLMPAEAGPLSAGELNLIETWINQGAQ